MTLLYSVMNSSNSASISLACSSRPNFSPRPWMEAYIPSTLFRFRKMDFTPMEAYLGCKSFCRVAGDRM